MEITKEKLLELLADAYREGYRTAVGHEKGFTRPERDRDEFLNELAEDAERGGV